MANVTWKGLWPPGDPRYGKSYVVVGGQLLDMSSKRGKQPPKEAGKQPDDNEPESKEKRPSR